MNYFLYALIFLIVLIIIFIEIKISQKNKKGKIGEKSVSKILKKCNGRTINGICLPLYDNITEIDHIFIGKMGIVVIETKNVSGYVSGNVNDANWVHKIGSKTHKLYNPIFQNKTHCDNVKHHLKKGNLNNIPIFSVVVFADNDVSLNISGKANVIKANQLVSFINSLPVADDFIPQHKIYNYLNNIAQNSMIKLYKHNKNIKRKK